jgi:TPR repeat/Tetratricopeptide repeat
VAPTTSSVSAVPELFSARSRLRDALSRAPVRSSAPSPDEPQTLPPSAIRPFLDEPSVPPALSTNLRSAAAAAAAAAGMDGARPNQPDEFGEPEMPTQFGARVAAPEPVAPIVTNAVVAPAETVAVDAPSARTPADEPAAEGTSSAESSYEMAAPRAVAPMPTIVAPAADDLDVEMPSIGPGQLGGLVDGDTDLAFEAVHDDEQSVKGAEGGGFRVEFESARDDQEDEDDVDEPVGPQLTDDADQARTSTVVASPTDNKQLSIEARQLVARAQTAEREGDLRLAVGYWSDALDFLADDGQIYMARGRASLSLGDYGGAMSDFQRAEDLDPQSADPVYEMGNLFYDRKDWARAIEYYDNALELDAAHALARCKRGLSHYYNHDPKQAFQDLQRAHALDPNIAGIRRYVQMAVKAMERDGR